MVEKLLDLEVTSLRVVDSGPMQDKDITRRFNDLDKRIDRIENTKTGELIVDSPFDRKLTKIAEDVSGIKISIAGIREKVDNHIKFAWVCISALFALCLGGAGLFYNMHGTLSEIQGSLPSGQIKAALVEPLDEQKLKRIQNIVTAARNSGMTIDPKVVSQAGTRLIDEAKANPSFSDLKWQTAMQLVEYRSNENAQLDPDYSNYKGGQPVPAPIEKLPPGIHITYRDNVIIGGTVQLDGGYWDGGIFKDSVIRYGGGPVILHNVKFENCRFLMEVSTPTINLGKELLASTVVTFKQPAL